MIAHRLQALVRLTVVSTLLLSSWSCRERQEGDARRWLCKADTDCINSCALGAVNEHWYRVKGSAFADCEDGCANQVAAPPRCVEGNCVAFQLDPSDPAVVRRNDSCTRKPMPER